MPLDAITAIGQMLKDHDVSPSLAGGVLSAGSLELSASVFKRPGRNGHGLLQLDINVRSPLLGGRTLVESFAGWGSNEDEALEQALAKFARSSLHVVLEVFVGSGLGGNQIEWETWTYGLTNWQVCLGPLVVMGFQNERPADFQCDDLLNRLRDGLLPTLAAQCHWLRFYYMTQNGARVGSECLLDNTSWPHGQNMVDEKTWPEGDYSVRNFLILLPNRHP